MPEHALLNDIIDCMEENGHTYNTVHLTINDKFVEEINEKFKTKYTIDELRKAADKCVAHEWLKRTFYGDDDYQDLQITPKGLGVAISKRKSDDIKRNRPMLKKASDSIEDHKGLIIFLGVLIPFAALLIKILGG